MPSRRHFLLTASGALAGLPALRAAAHQDDNLATLPPELAPQRVQLSPAQIPGEVHVVPDVYSLYWTLPFGEAIRYYVGVGRDSLYESGEFYVGAKKEWPSWTPTPSMIEREPEKYAQYADGMPGGPGNPLGARALYLFTEDKGDTFLRIHGTDKPETIRQDVSNGCARLVDAQVVDLYERVPMQTWVVLHPKDSAAPFVEIGAGGGVPQTAGLPEVEVSPLGNGAGPGAPDPLVERLRRRLQGLEGGSLY